MKYEELFADKDNDRRIGEWAVLGLKTGLEADKFNLLKEYSFVDYAGNPNKNSPGMYFVGDPPGAELSLMHGNENVIPNSKVKELLREYRR